MSAFTLGKQEENDTQADSIDKVIAVKPCVTQPSHVYYGSLWSLFFFNIQDKDLTYTSDTDVDTFYYFLLYYRRQNEAEMLNWPNVAGPVQVPGVSDDVLDGLSALNPKYCELCVQSKASFPPSIAVGKVLRTPTYACAECKKYFHKECWHHFHKEKDPYSHIILRDLKLQVNFATTELATEYAKRLITNPEDESKCIMPIEDRLTVGGHKPLVEQDTKGDCRLCALPTLNVTDAQPRPRSTYKTKLKCTDCEHYMHRDCARYWHSEIVPYSRRANGTLRV